MTHPAPTDDGAALGASLRELFGARRLSPSQRRIARYLLDHPEESAFLTSMEIAQRVGVSQPSVTRFAAALGFRGFPDFRDMLRASVLDAHRRPAGDAEPNDIQALVSSEIRDLEALRDHLADPSRLRSVAATLAASRPLPVIGLRISAPAAHLFGYLAAKLLPDVRVLDQPGSLLEDALSQAAETGASAVLAFGLPRYPRELAAGLTWARRVGLHVALITDQPMGPLAKLADQLLVAPVSSYVAFDSHAAPTVLCTALLHAMLESLGAEGQARLESFDDSAAERQLFLPS